MNKYLICILSFLLIILIGPPLSFTQQPALQKESKSFLWKIKSETATAYILGSIHMAKPSFYPLGAPIEKAFDESSKLVLEINPLLINESKTQQMLLDKGLYDEGKNIKSDITPDVLEMLNKYLEKMPYTLEMLQNMKPGMLAMTLSMQHMMQLGYSPEYGIDQYFAKKANGNKEILELETVEEQISLLIDTPYENLLLKYTLMEINQIDESVEQIVELWEEGDSEGIYNLILKPYENNDELKTIVDKLYYERNVKMTSKIRNYLSTDDNYFIVVGAGHLIGDRGIINLLRKGNYNIEQL